MTVASLWKALDRAGCGKPVGTKELQEHFSFHERTNPWNVNDKRPNHPPPTLAVDLSIWICEALTCSAFDSKKSKTDPSLHLVYTRTVKLLSLGIKLVMVIEGKRRTRHQEGDDKFRKRRNGTCFWNACQRCEQMLRLLGVPVVRAKAEGEALCALLNQKDIVDGVISNDGDCFLYGAKVLYTKFTLENLEKSMVMRYDISDIRACVDDDDGNEYDNEREPREIVSLDRSDLISFAILTGSDAVGAGLPKVGCRKAIRFIKKCQLDNPLKRKDAAMNELKSWARAAAAAKANPIDCIHDESQAKAKQMCSCCGHAGTKVMHQKHGCELCGTEPGEPCFALSPGAKFRSAMRKKAMAMEVDFDPESVIKVYQSPNDNQIPLPLLGKTSKNLQMTYPNLQGFQDFPMVIRGQNLVESRQYLKQSLSSLMARNELLNISLCENAEPSTSKKLPSNKTRPQPRIINKAMVRGGKPSFEVEWIVKATVTDAEGNPMDEFIFCTIEDQQMVKKRYPKLIEDFETREKEGAKQGDAEQEKRRAFLEMLCAGCDSKEEAKQKATDARRATGRCFREDKRASFGVSETSRMDKDDGHVDPMNMEITFSKNHRDAKAKKSAPKRKLEQRQDIWGDDADKLLRFVGVNSKNMAKDDGCTSIFSDDDSIATFAKEPNDDCSMMPNSLTPGHLHFLSSNQKAWYPSRDPLLRSNDRETSFKENHQPKDIQPIIPPNKSIACFKECCTSNKQYKGDPCAADESSVALRDNKNHNPVPKPRKPWFLRKVNSFDEMQQHEGRHQWSLSCPRDFELANRQAPFQAERQELSFEDCNQHYHLEDVDDICSNRDDEIWKRHHIDLISSLNPKASYNDDFLIQSPYRSKMLHPRGGFAYAVRRDSVACSLYSKPDVELGSKPRLAVGYAESQHRYYGNQFRDRRDSLSHKRRKIEFEKPWHTNERRNQSETSEVHRAKVLRPSPWEEADNVRVSRDPRNDCFFIRSYHREEEMANLDHSSLGSYSENGVPRKEPNEVDNLSNCHSRNRFSTHQLSRDKSLQQLSHGKREYYWPPRTPSCDDGNRSKVADGRVVEDAAEKLRTKLLQAALDEECRHLHRSQWY